MRPATTVAQTLPGDTQHRHAQFADYRSDSACSSSSDVECQAAMARVLRPGGTVFVHVPAHPLLFAQNTNLSWPLPRWAHSLLARTFAAELRLSRTRDLPTGHSLALVARKVA